MCHPSPASSCGVGGVVDSAGGTPYTSLTAFSPEDVKAMKSPGANLGSKTTGSSPQDPFVSSGAHSGGRLSAKASAFQPSFETRPPAAPAPSKAIESSRKMQGPNTSDHSEKLGSAQSPGGGLDTANPAQFGAFTTDSNISRVIKVTGKNVVATFLPFVEAAKKVSLFHFVILLSLICCLPLFTIRTDAQHRRSENMALLRGDQRDQSSWETLTISALPILVMLRSSTMQLSWTIPV